MFPQELTKMTLNDQDLALESEMSRNELSHQAIIDSQFDLHKNNLSFQVLTLQTIVILKI